MCRKQTSTFPSPRHHLLTTNASSLHPPNQPTNPPTPCPSALCVLHTAHFFHLRRTINRAPYHFKADTWSALRPSPTAPVPSICKIRATPDKEMAVLDQSAQVVEPGATTVCGHRASVRSAWGQRFTGGGRVSGK